MEFKLTINMNNAAFQDNGRATELIAIMAKVSAQVADGVRYGDCKDSNGNIVGLWSVR